MSVAKKLLLILELNQTLVYVHNNKTKLVDFGTSNLKINYNSSFEQFDFLYRSGRNQLMQLFFTMQSSNIDVAVWSNLDNEVLDPLCKNYFGRYYRQLLFIMGTNRALYSKNSTQRHQPLKIRKQLDNVYHRFSGYSSTNTLVLSSEQNLVQNHARNNIVIPRYCPKVPTFEYDVGGFALKKYIQGLLMQLQGTKVNDVRSITDSKQTKFIFQRLAHSTFGQKKYI